MFASPRRFRDLHRKPTGGIGPPRGRRLGTEEEERNERRYFQGPSGPMSRKAPGLYDDTDGLDLEEWVAQPDGSFRRTYDPDYDLPALKDVALGLDTMTLPSAVPTAESPMQSPAMAPRPPFWSAPSAIPQTVPAGASSSTVASAAFTDDFSTGPPPASDAHMDEARKQRPEGNPNLHTVPPKRPRSGKDAFIFPGVQHATV